MARELTPIDKQVVMGAACGALDRAVDLHNLHDRLKNRKARALSGADLRLLHDVASHLEDINNGLQDVARRMEG
jgi:hypothetical protein